MCHEAAIAQLKFDWISALLSVGLQTVTATMTVIGVDMNRDGFQTCCNSLSARGAAWNLAKDAF